jgi:hypothetical protein
MARSRSARTTIVTSSFATYNRMSGFFVVRPTIALVAMIARVFAQLAPKKVIHVYARPGLAGRILPEELGLRLRRNERVGARPYLLFDRLNFEDATRPNTFFSSDMLKCQPCQVVRACDSCYPDSAALLAN